MYYDPKSKLYCKDMRWHRHVPDQDPAFVPVEQEGTTSHQYPVEQNASVAGTSSAEAASTDAQAQAPATTNGSGVKAVAAVAAAAVTPATVKRSTSIGGKKQRIAFGFKGIKLVKPGVGSGAGGAVGSEEDGGGEPKGAEAMGGGVGMGGPGSLAKKRRLEDVSKWNARKLEVRWGMCLTGFGGSLIFSQGRNMENIFYRCFFILECIYIVHLMRAV